MSFKPNQNQQLTLNDSFINLSPRAQKIVMHSWAKDFADIVFPAINEERFSVLYSDKASRPNTPVNFTIGALMLKENSGLSDDEMLEAICCDVRYQYALHTTHLKEQPISDRTFSRFRERLRNYELETGHDLLEEEMMHLAEVYADYMKLNSNIKRMDSLMVASNCKRMSRLEIVYATTSNAVNLIVRLYGQEMIPARLLHYLDKDDYNEVIYYCKSEETAPRLTKAIGEAALVKELMADDEWHEFTEYQLLVRVLAEQAAFDEKGNPIPKDKKEISSSSLQNPSDPDATYRSKAGKAHKGYVGNLVETIGKDGDSLITNVDYQANTHSDSSFCKEYLQSREDGAPAETMITDGAYGGQENRQLANEKNVTLVTTALTGIKPDPFMADFELSEDGKQVIECPMGHKAIKTTYYPKTGMCRALFPTECCGNCPYREKCKPKEQRKSYAVHVSKNMVERAKYMGRLSTEEYMKLTKQRNAIEGIPSVLRRKYRIDEIPVFGLINSKMFFMLKIGVYNFRKLLRHNRRTRVKYAQNPAIA